MKIRRDPGIAALIIILMISNLYGQSKAIGELLIPSAEGEVKSYKATMTIIGTVILIKCQEKIFQPLNDFKAPRKESLRISMSEVIRINFLKNGLVIFPKAPLYNRHRNILIRISIFEMFYEKEEMAFLFISEKDISKEVGDNEKKIIDCINKMNDPHCHLCGCMSVY